MEWIVEAECKEDLVDGYGLIGEELVRCAECKHFREFDDDYKRRWRSNWDGMCVYWNAHSTMKDGFCSVAEEKTDKEEECYAFD